MNLTLGNNNTRPTPTGLCCIPSSDSGKVESEFGVGNQHHACRYLHAHRHARPAESKDGGPDGFNMTIQPGPHGHHAIASRDIPAGSLIVQCLPLAHSILVPPGTMMEDDEGDDVCGRRKRCTRCFFQEGDEDSSGMRRNTFGRCSKCRVAYYCSRSCQAEDWKEQHKLECRYYVKRRKQSPQSTPLYANTPQEDVIPLLLRTFNSLKYLRDDSDAVARSQEDETDTKQEDMIVSCGPHHFSSLMVSPEHYIPGSTAMKLAKDLIESFAVRGTSSNHAKKESTENKISATLGIWGYNECNSDNNDERVSITTDQAIQRAQSAFKKNNFGIVNSLHSPIGEGVYPCAALLNHSCNPNCILRYKLGVTNDFGEQQYHPPILQIVACRDICAGEELCHSYVDLALCTQERQTRLLDTHGFLCECIRCKKGGCLIELPKNREEWELWPLTSGYLAHGGGNDVDKKNRCFEKVDIDDAISSTGCRQLNDLEMEHINQQSHILQRKANQSMVEGDAAGELYNLQKAIELYTTRGNGGRKRLSPFYGQLYSVRCSYLSALLANGHILQAIEQCEHIVSFLALVFSHVQNHPLLGLQLYTLGDLYSGAVTMEGESLSEETKCSLKEKARLAYAWTQRVMIITHGANDPMVRTLEDNLSSTA
mmetsp:Transcript_27072/g.58034  ORF Transcript_27072/g.58034 Transcript_27072/m.58034 type:complete len:653 (-) Transcript_27072:2371-4329(-)